MSEIMCPECGENQATQRQRCSNSSIHNNKHCFCCHECHKACWEEYCEMIYSGEADQEVIDYYKGDN